MQICAVKLTKFYTRRYMHFHGFLTSKIGFVAEGRGFTPDPAGGASSTLLDPLGGGEGVGFSIFGPWFSVRSSQPQFLVVPVCGMPQSVRVMFM